MQFKDVLGQQEVKEHLIREVNADKIAHAQLFHGKNGAGSLQLALAFIQYLFCKEKTPHDSCGTCASCIRISKAAHPDLHFSIPSVLAISKTSDPLLGEWRKQLLENSLFDLYDWVQRIDPKERSASLGTDESQEILKKLSLKSYEGGYKVMIIWMAEAMNVTFANKILKILEEPPPKTLFLLLSEDVNRLLPTIVSRTQVLRIPSYNNEEVSQFLIHKGLNKSQADSIAARSEGNLIIANNFLNNDEEIDLNRELFIQLMRVCFKKNVNEMLDWTESISSLSKEGQKHFVSYSLHMVRQSILKNYTQNMLVKISLEESRFLENFSKFITNNNLKDFTQTLNNASYHLERNAHPKILFTQLCFQVMRFIHKA